MRNMLAIDQTTNDIFFREDGTLATVEGAEAVGLHARARLKTFRGEWFLDSTVGVPWLEQILGKGYDPVLGESVTKDTLLATDGVVAIETFSVSYDRATRGLILREIAVRTDYDNRVTLYG